MPYQRLAQTVMVNGVPLFGSPLEVPTGHGEPVYFKLPLFPQHTMPRLSFGLGLGLLASAVLAVPTNHTIDDAGPFATYIPSTDGLCVGCAPSPKWDPSQLTNGTVTNYPDTDNVKRAIELNFTGTAIYIYFAAPAAAIDLSQQCGWFLDGTAVGTPFFLTTHAGDTGQYNILAYSNTSLPAGSHSFQVQISANTAVNFDRAVYTSDDPVSTASSTTSSATSTTSSAARTSAAAAASAKKAPAAAIAGGIVGGLAGLLAVLGVVWLSRRRLRSRDVEDGVPPAMEELAPPRGGPTAAGAAPQRESALPVDADGDEAAAILAAKVLALEAEVQQMKSEREEGSSSVANTDVSAPTRSLSTMKRVQAHTVRNYEDGYTGADAVVHTDSGVRLTAARVDELPPTYAPE
ncbi:hypothetical protein DFH06DRAFT_1333953 [Mycena polygramma]|nr:hypothetical protein DFH06DRAFT_1333953 [Mycena polygramma]